MATRSFFYEKEFKKFEDKFVPPDRDLLELGNLINKTTKAGRVNFIGFKQDDDTVEWAIIFQNGSKRITVALHGRPTEDQVDEFVTALEAWVGYKGEGSLYTTELPKDPTTQWSW